MYLKQGTSTIALAVTILFLGHLCSASSTRKESLQGWTHNGTFWLFNFKPRCTWGGSYMCGNESCREVYEVGSTARAMMKQDGAILQCQRNIIEKNKSIAARVNSSQLVRLYFYDKSSHCEGDFDYYEDFKTGCTSSGRNPGHSLNVASAPAWWDSPLGKEVSDYPLYIIGGVGGVLSVLATVFFTTKKYNLNKAQYHHNDEGVATAAAAGGQPGDNRTTGCCETIPRHQWRGGIVAMGNLVCLGCVLVSRFGKLVDVNGQPLWALVSQLDKNEYLSAYGGRVAIYYSHVCRKYGHRECHSTHQLACNDLTTALLRLRVECSIVAVLFALGVVIGCADFAGIPVHPTQPAKNHHVHLVLITFSLIVCAVSFVDNMNVALTPTFCEMKGADLARSPGVASFMYLVAGCGCLVGVILNCIMQDVQQQHEQRGSSGVYIQQGVVMAPPTGFDDQNSQIQHHNHDEIELEEHPTTIVMGQPVTVATPSS